MQERRAVGPALTGRGTRAGEGDIPRATSSPAVPGPLLLLAAGLAAGVFALDQVTKTLAVRGLADGPVHVWWTVTLNLSFNSGIAFSLGPGLTPWITAVVVVLVVVLLALTRRVTSPAMAVALGLVLGGAIGNLADRLFRGHGGAVVDFIDVRWWPVFNVADIAITTGAVLLVLSGLREQPRQEIAPRS
ncbi:MAG TPA: signal peptidase II [Acidimicrobiales bacterium]|nr:signal peptidase II [Acidimicrobiales bacterium]